MNGTARLAACFQAADFYHVAMSEDFKDAPTMAGNDTLDTSHVPFSCPVCGQALSAAASPRSHEVTCPGCHSFIMTPAVGVGPGTRLDDFLLKRRIGRGAMADVYLAVQRSMERTVAVKILSPAWSSNEEMADRFRREVRTLARLGHPHIVTAFYAGRSRGINYLAMQFIEGGSLAEHLQRHGPMPEAEALSVVYKVADALRYAWKEHGLIHRDIKPANIMLKPDGEVLLTDLGISKFIYEDESMTHGPRVFGTPHYMSPEQAKGRLDLDFRSDQYSLGATLYHMLAGAPPFNSSDVKEIMTLQCNADPPPIDKRRPGVSRECTLLLERMMAKDPKKRYPSWDAVMEAAGEIISMTPTQDVVLSEQVEPAAPLSPAPPRSKPGLVERLAWLMVVLAVVAVVWLGTRFREEGPAAIKAIPADVREMGGAVRDQIGLVKEEVGSLREHREEDKRREELAARILEALDEEAARLVVLDQLEEAIAVYRDYEGPLADEIRSQRRERIIDITLPEE